MIFDARPGQMIEVPEGMTATDVMAREAEIPMFLDALGAQLDALSEVVKALHNRLDPVLRGAEPTEAPKQQELAARTTIGERIEQHVLQAARISQHVGELLQRAEI